MKPTPKPTEGANCDAASTEVGRKETYQPLSERVQAQLENVPYIEPGTQTVGESLDTPSKLRRSMAIAAERADAVAQYRKLMHAQFGYVAGPEGKCVCAYCVQNVDALMEHAAELEMENYWLEGKLKEALGPTDAIATQEQPSTVVERAAQPADGALRSRAHEWVKEQAELGERTDHKSGLSEFRIDAAEQAFIAGALAAQTPGGEK